MSLKPKRLTGFSVTGQSGWRKYGSSDFSKEVNPRHLYDKNRRGLPRPVIWELGESISRTTATFFHATLHEKNISILGHESVYLERVDPKTKIWKFGVDTRFICPTCSTPFNHLRHKLLGDRLVYLPGCPTATCTAEDIQRGSTEASRCQYKMSFRHTRQLSECKCMGRFLTDNGKSFRCGVHRWP